MDCINLIITARSPKFRNIIFLRVIYSEFPDCEGLCPLGRTVQWTPAFMPSVAVALSQTTLSLLLVALDSIFFSPSFLFLFCHLLIHFENILSNSFSDSRNRTLNSDIHLTTDWCFYLRKLSRLSKRPPRMCVIWHSTVESFDNLWDIRSDTDKSFVKIHH